MFVKLFLNQWKQNVRSPYLSNSIFQKVVLGLLALYFLVNFLIIGLFMGKILEEAFPGMEPISKFNSLLIYYFIFDILMRFFMQQFPVVSIQPYLTLPVKKSTIIHFLLQKSIPTFFNLLPFLFFIPYFIKSIIPVSSVAASIAWFVTFISMVLTANFVSFYLKKNFDLKPILILIVILLVGSLFYFDHLGYLGLATGMESAMAAIDAQPLLAAIPLGIMLLTYFGLYRFFRNRIYLDTLNGHKKTTISSSSNISVFSRFGKIGDMMDLEMKMIWRNPRSRTYLYLSVAFVLFPLMMIGQGHGMAYKIMFGILTTGMFAFNYAQLLLSWHSSHFDYLLTRNIKAEDLFKSKYYMLTLSVFALYIVMLPYSFFIESWFIISTMSMIFNIGFGIYLYMYIANFNSKKIDVSKGNTFNMEGFGTIHYLIMVPIILIPIVIYYFFNKVGYPVLGLWVFGLLGFLGFVFQESILKFLTTQFEYNKHTISSAFRNQ